MATLEQLSRALVQADAAGDAQGAKVLADAIREMRTQESAAQTSAPVTAEPKSLADLLRSSPIAMEQMGMTPAPAAAPIDNANNPMQSSLPGILGDFQNTLRAATRGAQDTSMLNMSDELFAGAVGLPQVAANAISGQGVNLDPVTQAYEQGTTQRQQTQALNPGAYDIGSILGTAALMGKPGATMASVAPSALKTAATGAAIGGTAGVGAGETLDERLMGGATGASFGAALGFGANKLLSPAKAAPPTVKAMFAKGDAEMANVAATGAVVAQPAAAKYVANLRGMLTQEGLITPSGKVANYPGVSHAVSLAEDFAAGNMTMANAKALRTALGDVAGAATKAERRVGVKMIKQLDDFMANLKPADFVAGNGKDAVNAWIRARSAYHTAFKGESVEKLIDTARRKKYKFGGSGHENAIRNQFDAFVGKEKNLRGFTPDERAQLARVVKGTVPGNIARGVGKLAPTGVVSAGLSGGVPFAVGTALGGPAAGLVAAGGSLTLGTIGRFVATLSTKHQAELARLLILNGGKLPTKMPAGVSPAVARAIGNITLVGGAKAPELGQQLLQLLTHNQSASTPEPQMAAQ